MRQAEKHNWNYQNKNPQFVFPVEPSQENNPEQDQDPFITLPHKSPESQHNNQGHNHSGHKGRGRGRGRGKGSGPSHGPNFFLSFSWQRVGSYNQFLPREEENTRTNGRREKGKTGQPHYVVRTFGAAVPAGTHNLQTNLPTHARLHLQPIPK